MACTPCPDASTENIESERDQCMLNADDSSRKLSATRSITFFANNASRTVALHKQQIATSL